jgi:hypothetical protein
LIYNIEATVRDFQWAPHSKKRDGVKNTPAALQITHSLKLTSRWW